METDFGRARRGRICQLNARAEIEFVSSVGSVPGEVDFDTEQLYPPVPQYLVGVGFVGICELSLDADSCV